MTEPSNDVVVVLGMGAGGWDGLLPRHQRWVRDADVLLGGARHLGLLPEVAGQVRRRWPVPLREGLRPLVEEYAGRRVVALASGDPLVSGVGTTLIEVLGRERVRIEPAVSSVALARARMGWPAEQVDTVSVVGRDPSRLARVLGPGRRVVVLSSDGSTPAALAALLVGAGYGASVLTVWSELGADTESSTQGTAAGWGDAAVPPLNVVCVECRRALPGGLLGLSAGLPDSAFESDGQLTKRDVRSSALARLAPAPGQLLWDVGAGAGSISIEWLRTDPRCRAVAVEADSERADRVRRNASRLGVPELTVVTGRAPEALTELDQPDAVFVGGGATVPGVLEHCWTSLRPGGRLVVHGVTLETEALLLQWYRRHGGELTRLSVEHAGPLGSFTGWTSARPVVQWSVEP